MANPQVELSPHRITVLLIDDQASVGEAVRRMIETETDMDFHFCQDPTEALRIANQVGPTVILQDLIMPDINGLRLVKYFRANPATRDVPLIVLSAKEEPETKAEAFALGANDYLVKLPDKLELIARLRYHSRGYINLLERNEAYNALLESRRQLELRNRFIRKTFGRYLSDDVVDSILESPEGTQLGGEKRGVTLMMSDLRGFTAISERLPAEDVVRIINHYLSAMTEIILHYQGTIDEFIGDSILVIFGAPIRREDDAQRAVACALEMQLAMTEVNQKNRAAGYPEVTQGIGIHTGEVVVGNIGSEKRSKYGVVGRHVNLSSRIESYTVGGQILISEATCRACGDILRIDDQLEVMPKGVKAPLTIYEVGGIGGRFALFLPEKKELRLSRMEPLVPIRFFILEGKDTNREYHPGHIAYLSSQEAEIVSERNCRRLTNLRLSLLDEQDNERVGELYAKVIRNYPHDTGRFRVCFTAVPPEARDLLEELLRDSY